jgi:hypothetical protein
MTHTWKTIFGLVAAELTADGLSALRNALANDDPRLTQGSTVTPPPMRYVLDWPVEGACPIGFAGWWGDGLATVGQVEEHFARVCTAVDQDAGEAGAVRHFLNWFDDTPRDEARRLLLVEVEKALAARLELQAQVAGTLLGLLTVPDLDRRFVCTGSAEWSPVPDDVVDDD